MLPLAVIVIPVEFVMVIVSEAPVSVAVTDWLVTVSPVEVVLVIRDPELL
jgi:hypothetical protein